MYILGMVLFVLSWWASGAEAACSGSGTTWSCLVGSTSGDIQSALYSASDGATITFAAGTYTATSFAKFTNATGATLKCATPPSGVGAATVNPCVIINANQPVFGSDTFAGVNNHFYRISGFTFDLAGGAPSLGTIYWDSYNGGAGQATLQRVRVDHNTFRNGSNGAQITLIGSGGPPPQVMQVYGVYDHNLYTNATQLTMVHWTGTSDASPPAAQAGTANNLFLEDNLLSFTTVGNASAEGCTDGWGGAAYVARYNTSTNCLWAAHGAQHSGGPANYEFYGNTVTMNAGSVAAGEQDCYRCFHHQGSGEIMAFNNTFTAYSGKTTEAISVAHYRSFGGATPTQCDGTSANPPDGNRAPTTTYRGYPCWHQPGRDFLTVSLKPMYNWNNRWSDTGAKIDLVIPGMSGTPNYSANHLQANRDYYNAVSASPQTSASSPFNGTTGMGFGSLANRPTACTTNALESGGGVGYFATDQGAQGTLYRCSATNTWSVQYTPYTYPHPLQAGGGGGNTSAPGAPINLRVQ